MRRDSVRQDYEDGGVRKAANSRGNRPPGSACQCNVPAGSARQRAKGG